MKKEIELLAPGGDIDSIKAAILAGANAIYCGLDKFNARSQAKNIALEDLPGILRLAHQNDCEVFLTLNIIIIEREIPALFELFNKLVKTKIDGIIIQDLGVFYLINKYFPTLNIHASTQMTTHNKGQVKFLKKLKATRVNLSRELNIEDITELTSAAHEQDVLTEVFVHGSNCISFSGLCYMSSVTGGNSGNRGQCSQPCRDEYLTTAEGKNFPLNIKDNSAFSDLRVLADAGVDSIKIEGRIKKYHYVYTVVETWRKQLQSFYELDAVNEDNGELRKVFNRDFSNSFLKGDMSRNIFIDNPRDNSAIHLSKNWDGAASENLSRAKKVLFEQKSQIIDSVKDRIDNLSIEKAPIKITLSGKLDQLLTATVITPDATFDVSSNVAFVTADPSRSSSPCIESELVLKRFKALNDAEYFIDVLEMDGIESDLYIPLKELTVIKDKILFVLNDSKELVRSTELPKLEVNKGENISPSLSLLISSEDDLSLCNETNADIYFQIPNHFKNKLSDLIELFSNNKRLIPWFPAVLMGENYDAAIELLEMLQPERIVTNNSGIAYAAYEKGVSWLAGPYMNLVNSYSLLCLKENFNCDGAFISNEISQAQIKKIVKPDDFELTYSISHPIVLMTTIACMFHQVSGCKKNIVDDKCIQRCKNSASITNLKDISYYIDKEKGGYHTVYNETNFLNTEITTEIPDVFNKFFIDLRDIKTNTTLNMSKAEIVSTFEKHINGDSSAADILKQNISPSTSAQYSRGI